MRVAALGTRGVPAMYGGFETAVEEVGRRLVERGHQVTVYCRRGDQEEHLGMRRVRLPMVHRRSLETLSHTGLSVAHVVRTDVDAVLLFNSANAPYLPALRARGIPTALHVDGLEWQRAKWSGLGRAYYRSAESLGVRWADALIADSLGIQAYYRDEFNADTVYIAYGAPLIDHPALQRLDELGLSPQGYHLVVARFEPENHVDMLVSGYRMSSATQPLVVVGSAPYGDDYMNHVRSIADRDPRIRLMGAVWDQEQLDALYAGAVTYLHGHSVGGTNPSLLRAMGAGAATVAFDCVFNRETLEGDGWFFTSPAEVASALAEAEASPESTQRRGDRVKSAVHTRYDWDKVADGYESLLQGLVAGQQRRGSRSGRRTGGYRATVGPASPKAT
jgi:glycosyltransferase involved in cell wall biosynthesis